MDKELSTHNLQLIADSIAKALLHFGFVYSDFDKLLQRSLVLEAKKLGLKTDVDLSRITGLDRRKIKPLINKTSPKKSTNKLLLVLGRIDSLIKSGVQEIPLKDSAGSFYEICRECTNGRLTPVSIKNGLIEARCIEVAYGKVKLLNSHIETFPDDEFTVGFIGRSLRASISTSIYNLEAKKSDAPRRFEQKLSSTQINPKNQKNTEEKIRLVLSSAKSQIMDILTGDESNVPRDTFNELGTILKFYNLEE